MVRVALTKLLILIILAFIICLPEFFMSHRVLRANFLCVPYVTCEEWIRERKETTGDAEAKAKGLCDPCLTPGSEKQDFECTRGDWSNGTASWSEFNISRDPGTSWFLCETDTDMTRLHHNRSLSGLDLTLEVSVEVRLSKAGSVNLTLHGHVNHSSLYLHPEEEEEKEEGEGQRPLYCYLPGKITKESGNNTHCVLQLTNQTISNATVNRELPWKQTQNVEWWIVFTVLCLVVLLLTVLTTVIGKINQNWHGRANVFSSCGWSSDPDLSGGEMRAETTIQRGLSPIHEIPDTLLDGDTGHESYDSTGGYIARLHHRGHPCVSSITEEEA